MIMLGIDVSKTKIDCCIFPQGLTGKRKNKIFTNTESGFGSLLKWLINLKIEPDQVTAIMEATSVYHENLGYYLYDAGVKVCVANPSRVRAFAKGMSMLNKTDKADSEALSRYGYTAKLIIWQPEPETVRLLKALLGRRDVYLGSLLQEKNRLEKAQSTHIVNTSKNQYNTNMSYPIHFRKKILAKLEEGQSIRAVAQHFEINKNTIVEWKKRIEIKRTRPRKPSKVDDDALRADVEQYPDDYQYERAARFGCGTSTIGDALKRLNITVKKRPYGTRKQKQNSENSI